MFFVKLTDTRVWRQNLSVIGVVRSCIPNRAFEQNKKSRPERSVTIYGTALYFMIPLVILVEEIAILIRRLSTRHHNRITAASFVWGYGIPYGIPQTLPFQSVKVILNIFAINSDNQAFSLHSIILYIPVRELPQTVLNRSRRLEPDRFLQQISRSIRSRYIPRLDRLIAFIKRNLSPRGFT